MNRFFALLFLHCFAGPAFAAQDYFFSGSWDEAFQKAKQENKFVFIDCYTDWCSWCKVMDRETFPDTAVSRELSSHFVAIRREMQQDAEGRAIRLKFHVKAYPSYLILSADGKLVSYITGYSPAPEFLQKLRDSQVPARQSAFPGFSTKLDPGFPSYFLDLQDPGKTKENRENEERYILQAQQLLDTCSNLYGEVPWATMWIFMEIDPKYDKWILDNADTLNDLYGDFNVSGMLMSSIGKRVIKAAADNDRELLSQALADCRHSGKDSTGARLNFLLLFTNIQSDWTMMQDVLQLCADTADFSKPDPAYLLNDFSWQIYERCGDSSVVASAAIWMEKCCSLYPEYALLDTYAALLYKSGRYEKAEKIAEQAIVQGKKEDKDIAGTEELLKKIREKR